MATQVSRATWKGTLKEGKGKMVVGDGHYKGPFTFASRFETGKGTNPEELIGAAHAGCYSMFLSALLTNNDYPPTKIKTTATVHLGAGPTITQIDLVCKADVPNIDAETFQDLAQKAKEGCPVSKALAAVETMTLDAQLVS